MQVFFFNLSPTADGICPRGVAKTIFQRYIGNRLRSFWPRHVVSDFAWGGGGKCPPQAKLNSLTYFFIEFLNVWKRAHHPPPPQNVLAISNGIVTLPEYILTNSHFQLRKDRNCDRILIFGDIIYGKLNLYIRPRKFLPPQGFLGRGGGAKKIEFSINNIAKN